MTEAGRSSASSSGEKWGMFSATQNLPSALQNPKKGINREFFTRSWGESFVELRTIPQHITLPDVSMRHVDPYLRRMKKRHKLLHRLQQHEEEKEKQQLELCSTSHHQPRSWISSGDSSIPSLFFSSNFSLEDVNTFYSVFNHLAPTTIQPSVSSSDGSSTTPPKDPKIIQEKLLQHLEIVESKMCSHIASKSSAFFQSMSHLSVHMDQLKQNQQAVSELRGGISRLHQEAVVTPVTLLSLPRRRANILKTYRILEMMSVVREVQGTIRVMLSRREFITALDLINTASQILENELTTIRSFRNMSGELTEQVRIIEKMVSLDFTKYVTEDLNRPLDDVSPLLGEDHLITVVFGVLRLNKADFLNNLKEEIYAAINACVKQCVAESVSKSNSSVDDTVACPQPPTGAATSGNNSELPGVGEMAKSLPLSEWLALLNHLTACLKLLLKRYKAIVDVIIQAVEASAGTGQVTAEEVHAASIVSMSNGGMVAGAWCNRVVESISEGLCHACDFAHDRCAKLLHARSRNNGLAKMSVSEFMNLSGIIERFVSATEDICGKKSSPFRMGLQGQCVVFVQRFHADREGRLKANLSTERWKPVPAPPDLQVLCNHIDSTGLLVASNKTKVSPVTENGANNCDGSVRTKDTSACKDINGSDRTSNEENNAGIDRRRYSDDNPVEGPDDVVVFGGKAYVVVGVAIVVVRIIVEYAECASTLQMAAQPLLSGLADLLRRFNSDTCRLLLEAGAVSLGGLKTISTRHLALAHRCLHLLLSLLLPLQAHFSQLLKPVMVEKTIAQLEREFREHCSALEVKIITVVGDQLDRLLSSWEARSPVPSPAMNGILKALTRLHEAITGILTQSQVSEVFGRLTVSLRCKLKAHLQRLNVMPVGPQSWVVTSELTFYFNHLASLKIDPRCSQEEFSKLLWAADDSKS